MSSHRRSKMIASELSPLEALDAIRSIPEWLRAVSNTASHLRRNLDALEKEAVRFRIILHAAKEWRARGSLAAVRNEGSELVAGIGRSAAMMRRFQLAFERRCPGSDPAAAPTSIEAPTRFGSLTLAYVPVFVRLNGAPVSFTRIEERLLAALWTARGYPLSGAELTQRIWSNQPAPTALSVHISHLRKKLDASGVVIEFVRGAGYHLVLESEQAAGDQRIASASSSR
jgi:DNA-binding winged helix-turn-helix (wHTH) protein